MRRAVVMLALVALGGCRDEPRAPSRGLRVPLLEGWVATPVGDRLEVGPHRVVLTLESRTVSLPSLDALAAAVQADGLTSLQKESTRDFRLVRYLLGSDAGTLGAFVGVKQVEGVTVWCASTALAKSEDLEPAVGLCRGLSVGETK